MYRKVSGRRCVILGSSGYPGYSLRCRNGRLIIEAWSNRQRKPGVASRLSASPRSLPLSCKVAHSANHEELPNHRASNGAEHQTCSNARSSIRVKQKRSSELSKDGPRSVSAAKGSGSILAKAFVSQKYLPFSHLQAGVCL